MLTLTGLLLAATLTPLPPGGPCTLDFVVPVPRHMIPTDPNHQFGAAVATDGDVLAVGIPYFPNGGAVAVFKRVPLGWALQDFLQSSVPTTNNDFGLALDLHGDLLVVGERGNDLASTDAGAVFVYRFDPGTGDWAVEDVLHSPDPLAIDAGVAVSTDGDTIIMGTGSNRVDTFRMSGGSWQAQMPLFAPDPLHNVTFGDAVAVDGDLLLVADDRHSDPGVSKAGRVYTYARNGNSWTFGATIAPPTPTASAIHLGEELDLDGHWAIVSAHLNDSATAQPGGQAHVYELASDGSVIQHQALAPSPGAPSDAFSRGVAVKGTRILVGAPGENGNAGGAYQYDLVNGSWQLTFHRGLPAGTFHSEGNFGHAVGVDDFAVIAAHRPSQLDDGGLVFIVNPCTP